MTAWLLMLVVVVRCLLFCCPLPGYASLQGHHSDIQLLLHALSVWPVFCWAESVAQQESQDDVRLLGVPVCPGRARSGEPFYVGTAGKEQRDLTKVHWCAE